LDIKEKVMQKTNESESLFDRFLHNAKIKIAEPVNATYYDYYTLGNLSVTVQHYYFESCKKYFTAIYFTVHLIDDETIEMVKHYLPADGSDTFEYIDSAIDALSAFIDFGI